MLFLLSLCSGAVCFPRQKAICWCHGNKTQGLQTASCVSRGSSQASGHHSVCTAACGGNVLLVSFSLSAGGGNVLLVPFSPSAGGGTGDGCVLSGPAPQLHIRAARCLWGPAGCCSPQEGEGGACVEAPERPSLETGWERHVVGAKTRRRLWIFKKCLRSSAATVAAAQVRGHVRHLKGVSGC